MMKRLLAILLFFPTLAWADVNGQAGPTVNGQAGPTINGVAMAAAPSYLFNETFGGSTLCFSGMASVCDNAWDYANTVTFAAGSLTLASGVGETIVISSANDTLYYGVKMTWSSGTNRVVLRALDASNTELCDVTIYSNNLYVVNTGGSNQNDSTPLTAGNDYYIKLKATKGTGSNAACQASFSTNGTSWTWTAASTNGTWTAQPSRMEFQGSGGAGADMVYKAARISTSDFNF